MNRDEKQEARLLSVKINNTAVLILFYLSLTMIIRYIPSLYYYGYSMINLLEVPISELLSNFDQFALLILNSFFYLIIVSFLLYILIKCVIIRYNYRESEDSRPKWLFFRLNKTSLIILLILSLINLIINLNSLCTSIGYLIMYLGYPYLPPSYVINQYILLVIISIILILIYVYTLIITIKKRKEF